MHWVISSVAEVPGTEAHQSHSAGPLALLPKKSPRLQASAIEGSPAAPAGWGQTKQAIDWLCRLAVDADYHGAEVCGADGRWWAVDRTVADLLAWLESDPHSAWAHEELADFRQAIEAGMAWRLPTEGDPFAQVAESDWHRDD